MFAPQDLDKSNLRPHRSQPLQIGEWCQNMNKVLLSEGYSGAGVMHAYTILPPPNRRHRTKAFIHCRELILHGYRHCYQYFLDPARYAYSNLLANLSKSLNPWKAAQAPPP